MIFGIISSFAQLSFARWWMESICSHPYIFLHQPLQFYQTNVDFKVLKWKNSTNYVGYIHSPMIDEKLDPRSKAKLLPPNCSTTMTSLKMLLALDSSKQWEKTERKIITRRWTRLRVYVAQILAKLRKKTEMEFLETRERTNFDSGVYRPSRWQR